MKWIELETALKIYEQVIKSTGGTYGVRDKGILESALYAPLATFDDNELYPGIIKKVAVLLFAIANNHPFVDGNKRVAFVVALTVLSSNGYEFNCNQDEVIEVMLEIAQGKLDYKQIALWLKANVEKNG